MTTEIKWYKHKVFCNTESAWVERLTETDVPLTVCPNNNTHTINSNSSTIISTLSNKIVKIQEENPNADTGGFYCIRGRAFTVQGNSSHYDAFLPRIPFSILRGNLKSRPELEGDLVTAYVMPQNSNVVGYCTQDIHDGDTIIHVSNTVLAMIELNKFAQAYFQTSTGRKTIKYHIIAIDFAKGELTLEIPVNIEDNDPFLAMYGIYVYLDSNIAGIMTTPNNLNQTWINIASPMFKEFYRGRFINLFCHNQCISATRMIITQDTINNRVQIDEPFDIALTPSGDVTVFVQLAIKTVETIELDPSSSISVGQGTIGGSYISPDVVLVLVYTRVNPTPARIRYNYEILY
jgi:hypothetical protein